MPIRDRRPRPRRWSWSTTASAGSPRRSSGQDSSTASATAPSCPNCWSTSDAARLPTSAPASSASTASTSRTWSRDLPGGRESRRHRRSLQPDRWRARDQAAVCRPGRRAGGLEASHPAHPHWPGQVSRQALRRRGQAPRAKNPPIINKARFKFLALNLDYSIEKARRVLGYQPPFTFERGIERAMAEHRPPAPRADNGRRGELRSPE